MDKSDIVKVIVVVVALLFITELFFFGGGFRNGGPSAPSGENISGTVTFNGTIRTYDPLLVLPSNTSQAVLDDLRKRSDVKDISSDPNGLVVQTETRDDVYPLGQYLRKKGISSVSFANVVLPQTITLSTYQGEVNVSGGSNVVSIVMEPLIDSGEEVTVSMAATARGGVLVSYSSASIMLQRLDLLLETEVVSLESQTYTYSIPWEDRSSLDLSGYGNVSYNRLDSIVFTTPLTVSQIVEKSKLPYVTFIDSGSAQVESSFDNASRVAADFGDAQYSLPASRLSIRANETPDLPFNSTESYTYTLKLKDPAYDFEEDSFSLDTAYPLTLNSTLNLSVSALAAGNRILSVTSFGLQGGN